MTLLKHNIFTGCNLRKLVKHLQLNCMKHNATGNTSNISDNICPNQYAHEWIAIHPNPFYVFRMRFGIIRIKPSLAMLRKNNIQTNMEMTGVVTIVSLWHGNISVVLCCSMFVDHQPPFRKWSITFPKQTSKHVSAWLAWLRHIQNLTSKWIWQCWVNSTCGKRMLNINRHLIFRSNSAN